MRGPRPFGFSLADAPAFYWACFVVFLVTVAAMAIFVASPFGAALRGARDQPRRMTALGYNVWLTRFLAFLFSGFWSGVAGLLYLYYNQFVSPQTVALSASAEALLMVIAGGTATLLGPIAGAVLVIVMKDVASAYIERWNFVLGAIFVLIVVFMPEGLVPGCVRLWRRAIAHARSRAAQRRCARRGRRTMTALEVRDLHKSFGGLRVATAVNLAVAPGERRLIIGQNGAGKTTLFNLITGELRDRLRHRSRLFGTDITRRAARRRAHLGLARTYQIITLFPGETLLRNVTLSLLGLSPLRWNPIVRLDRQHDLLDKARDALASVGPRPSRRSAGRRRPPMASGGASRSPWRWRRTRKCCCWTNRSPACRSRNGATCWP